MLRRNSGSSNFGKYNFSRKRGCSRFPLPLHLSAVPHGGVFLVRGFVGWSGSLVILISMFVDCVNEVDIVDSVDHVDHVDHVDV